MLRQRLLELSASSRLASNHSFRGVAATSLLLPSECGAARDMSELHKELNVREIYYTRDLSSFHRHLLANSY